MTRPGDTVDLTRYHKGVIHLHSRYSHDGHDTLSAIASKLSANGIDFCIVTDHFEDFDAQTFENYLAEIDAMNRSHRLVIVSAVEADVDGFHVILVPVASYNEIARAVARSTLPNSDMLKILVHPTKRAIPEVIEFLRAKRLDGIEVWNQQADGNYLPPAAFIRSLFDQGPADIPAIFFGTDLHNVEHRVTNLLLIERQRNRLTSEFVIRKLRQREFMNYNRNLGGILPGDSNREAIRSWVDEMARAAPFNAIMRRSVRARLRALYRLLPRGAKRSLNDFKNAVKSRL